MTEQWCFLGKKKEGRSHKSDLRYDGSRKIDIYAIAEKKSNTHYLDIVVRIEKDIIWG